MEWLTGILAGLGGIEGFLKSAALWTVILFVAGRILPRALFVRWGELSSLIGRTKLGKLVWEPVEDAIIERGSGWAEGANRDDAKA